MLCDNCRERDAVIQVMQIVDKGPVKHNLCEKCAAEKGFETTVSAPKNPLVEFLMPAQKALPATLAEAGRCPFCSSTLRDFRTTGRLGCARCYTSFEASLRDLLRRVHGSHRHVGKRYEPPRPEMPESVGTLSELRERLRRAVENEQFELAAELRDQIRVLE
ncbi:MAG TPA: UvrB/UvrC motif-containing protein [Gemmatimonadaceae bacterium]|nr:UvrB/UvrC motif-containing protein [Gemmatimonadaceae bacterium]